MEKRESQLWDYLSTLPPWLKAALQKRTVYQRYLVEWERLEALRAAALAQTGASESRAVLAQGAVVRALGEAVMEELRGILAAGDSL